MPIIYTKDAQDVYIGARKAAAELIQSGYSLDQANGYLEAELAYAIRLDDMQIGRNARACGEGHALVHDVLEELAA